MRANGARWRRSWDGVCRRRIRNDKRDKVKRERISFLTFHVFTFHGFLELAMMRLAAAVVVLVVFVSSTSAQIIYEPVRYQYGSGENVYYYGGSDPAMFRYAKHDVNV